MTWKAMSASAARTIVPGRRVKQADFIVLPMGILAVSDTGAWFGDAS